MTELTCRSCRHYTHTAWCKALGLPAVTRCERFSYEPGTDEAEQLQRAIETAKQEGLVR